MKPDAEDGEARRDRLGEAFRQSTGGDRFAVHPEAEVFERFALRELGAEERAAFLDHAVACPECAPLLRAVEELRRERPDRADSAVAARPAAGAARRMRWVIAASALAAGLAFVVLGPVGEDVDSPGELRANAPPRLVALEPRGHLDAAPLRARWEPLAGAVESGVAGEITYRLIVLRDDGASVAEIVVDGSGASTVAWPETARAPGRYVWSVEAQRDGERVARSLLVDVEW
jgi:hypothetical protein